MKQDRVHVTNAIGSLISYLALLDTPPLCISNLGR